MTNGRLLSGQATTTPANSSHVIDGVDPHGILAWLAPRAIEGVERVGAVDYARTLRSDAGPIVVSAAIDGSTVSFAAEGASAPDRSQALFAIEQLFAPSHPAHDGCVPTTTSNAPFDAADTVILAAAVRHGLTALVHQIDAGPVAHPGCADPHEMVMRAIIGQQISVRAATGQLRLLSGIGEVIATNAGLVRLFPTPSTIVEGATSVLRGPRAKTETVVRIASAIAHGDLLVAHGVDTRALQQQLPTFKGIGPWTAGYISLRLGDPDVFLPGDSAVRAGGKALGIADPAALAVLAGECAGFRSRLMLRCWKAMPPPRSSKPAHTIGL